MVIYIPIMGEQLEEGASSLLTLPTETNKEQKININKADVATLATLPGIGPSKALSILTYREENGQFQTIDDLKMLVVLVIKHLKS